MPYSLTSPKVSIILPTYNRARYIIETITSIQNQTYKNWELIIADDRSDDNTGKLIAQLKDERILYFRTASRLGITGTRNAGMGKANSGLIAFIDSDDLWADTKLEKQIAALEQYPDAGFSLTGGFNFRNHLEPVDYFYKQTNGTKCDYLLIPYFKSEVSTTTSSLIFHRKCLDTTGIFNEAKVFAEVDLILNLARRFKGIILYEPLLYRRLHDSNISNAAWKKGYAEGIALIQAYKNMLPSKITRNAFFRLYINAGEDHLLHKERKNAIILFFNAWKNKPISFIPFRKVGKAVLQYLGIKN